ncbi:MAG: DUF349 domain-containing protein, partial [Actinomyces sp.]|nr:DUF349 domain-containing protein [Actinomyces sp.]
MTISPNPQQPSTGSPETASEPARTEFGRMDTERNIYVTDGESERLIGSYPEGAPDNPFELYERR